MELEETLKKLKHKLDLNHSEMPYDWHRGFEEGYLAALTEFSLKKDQEDHEQEKIPRIPHQVFA